MATIGSRTARWTLSTAGFVAEITLWVLVSLAVWVALPALTLGWSPTLVTSGSMGPTVAPGDILLLDRSPGLRADLGPGTVVTFPAPEDPQRWITHRVVGLDEQGRYVTRGDANADPDPRPVEPDALIGVARLVVPLAGIPLRWVQDDEHLLLGAFLLTVLAAIWLASHPVARALPDRPGPVVPLPPTGALVTVGPGAVDAAAVAHPPRVRLRPLVPRSHLGALTRLQRAPALTASLVLGLAFASAMPYTAARFDARGTNGNNTFAAALADDATDPVVLVLPPVGGADVATSGNDPVTITAHFVAEGPALVQGTATATMRVRGSTPGNPPRELEAALLVDGAVAADASIELRDTSGEWFTVTLPLAPTLDVAVATGTVLEVQVTIRRLDLAVDGPSFVTLPG